MLRIGALMSHEEGVFNPFYALTGVSLLAFSAWYFCVCKQTCYFTRPEQGIDFIIPHFSALTFLFPPLAMTGPGFSCPIQWHLSWHFFWVLAQCSPSIIGWLLMMYMSWVMLASCREELECKVQCNTIHITTASSIVKDVLIMTFNLSSSAVIIQFMDQGPNPDCVMSYLKNQSVLSTDLPSVV